MGHAIFFAIGVQIMKYSEIQIREQCIKNIIELGVCEKSVLVPIM